MNQATVIVDKLRGACGYMPPSVNARRRRAFFNPTCRQSTISPPPTHRSMGEGRWKIFTFFLNKLLELAAAQLMARKEAVMTWLNIFSIADDHGVRAPARVCLGGPLPDGQHFRRLTAAERRWVDGRCRRAGIGVVHHLVHQGKKYLLRQSQTLVDRAADFAVSAHRRAGCRRKYTGEPYEVHPRRVAALTADAGGDDYQVAAAWLHDVVEDTPTTIADIAAAFGADVAQLVDDLTDVSQPADGNRQARKAVDAAHTAQATARAKTIKLADLIDNVDDICRHDPRFGLVFAAEARQLLPSLREGSPILWQRLANLLDNPSTTPIGMPDGQTRNARERQDDDDGKILSG